MKLSKILILLSAGLICLAIVVLTAHRVLTTDVAQPYLAVVNANIKDAKQQPLGSAMLLKADRIERLSAETSLNDLPVGTVIVDMQGKTIVPGKVSQVAQISSELLSQGITTVQITPVSKQDAKDYYWGRQHGWYDVRIQLQGESNTDINSDHLLFVGAQHQHSKLVGSLVVGGFADFLVFDQGKLEQTWLGGVKRYQVQ